MRRHLTIPECRELLRIIAAALPAAEARRVRYVIGHMKRRPAVRMTPEKARPVTPAIRARIRHLAATSDMNQMEIGLAVGVNAGRVSEVLAGKRR